VGLDDEAHDGHAFRTVVLSLFWVPDVVVDVVDQGLVSAMLSFGVLFEVTAASAGEEGHLVYDFAYVAVVSDGEGRGRRSEIAKGESNK
jgi:hypothetical protein